MRAHSDSGKSTRKTRRRKAGAARVACPLGLGSVLPGGNGLAVSFADRDWQIVIRRVDLKPDPGFACYHAKQVSARDVMGFLPNWASLKWVRTAGGSSTPAESFGLDREYLVSVAARTGDTVSHSELIAGFLDFLRDASD